MTKRVAIIGAAHRFPGTTPETFWQDLQAEKDLVTQVAPDRWSHEAFWHPDKRHPGTSVTFAGADSNRDGKSSCRHKTIHPALCHRCDGSANNRSCG